LQEDLMSLYAYASSITELKLSSHSVSGEARGTGHFGQAKILRC
jgi:hypothetical protein